MLLLLITKLQARCQKFWAKPRRPVGKSIRLPPSLTVQKQQSLKRKRLYLFQNQVNNKALNIAWAESCAKRARFAHAFMLGNCQKPPYKPSTYKMQEPNKKYEPSQNDKLKIKINSNDNPYPSTVIQQKLLQPRRLISYSASLGLLPLLLQTPKRPLLVFFSPRANV